MKDNLSLYHSTSPEGHRPDVFPQDEAVGLWEYVMVIFRHRRAVTVFFLLATILTMLSIPWNAPPSYTAKTTLHIQSPTRDVIDTPEMALPGLNYYGTQLGILTSRSLAAEVVRNLGLEDKPGFRASGQSPLAFVMSYFRESLASMLSWFKSASNEESKKVEFEFGVHPTLVDFYLNSLNVRPVELSELVNVEFRSADAALARAVANAHVAAFIQRNLSTRFELTGDVRQYLQKKLEELKVNLEQSEKALSDFQRAHRIVSLEKGENVVLERLKLVSADLTQSPS